MALTLSRRLLIVIASSVVVAIVVVAVSVSVAVSQRAQEETSGNHQVEGNDSVTPSPSLLLQAPATRPSMTPTFPENLQVSPTRNGKDDLQTNNTRATTKTTESPTTRPTTTTTPSQFPSFSQAPSSSQLPSINVQVTQFITDSLLPLFVPVSGEEPFRDPASPQFQAALFLAYELLMDMDEDDAQSTTWAKTTTLPIINQNEMSKFIQRYVLVILYYSLNGPGWTQRSNWLSHDHDECDWAFVTCDSQNGLIYSFAFIDIPGPGLLSRLDTLKLTFGNLTGNFLSNEEYLAWPELTTLWLSHNQWTGRLPESIASLSRLTSLRLESNGLTGHLPTTLGQMNALTELYLQNNALSGSVVAELGAAPQLRELRLEENTLNGSLPDGFYNNFPSSHLSRVELSRNRISGTLSSLVGNLQQLQILALDHNEMTGVVPTELARLTNSLSLLYLNANLFSGSVPDEVCSLRSSTSSRGFLRYFNADCAVSSNDDTVPPHQCSCCNWCCVRGTDDCTKQ
ncbi:LRR receptor-like serine threonine-protein kinase [Seminavis robusta]|uniref:LRR receptor-like serine threonine-protein kinase n=1 Tax=Seminavis robusta TaxID=568900 RepID=A0A9N8DYJ5_9STRA|nr:LRR receptor-like serine threonine-protein kinase [Seminavis robusta]|eukprot:Sro454_g146320.1 LRR receptor-like serine threonine-protein kinase (513) ;mRNA; f:25795-27435